MVCVSIRMGTSGDSEEQQTKGGVQKEEGAKAGRLRAVAAAVDNSDSEIYMSGRSKLSLSRKIMFTTIRKKKKDTHPRW